MDGSMDWMWKQGLEPLEILNQMAGFETHSESPELSRESATRDRYWELDGESLSTSEALRFRRARARDETVRYYGYSDLLLQKNGYSDLDRPRAGPDVHGRCPSRAAGAQLRRDTRRARSWSGRARRQHVAGGGGPGARWRLPQLHVPFRGMLATQMCTCTSKINIILEFKICPIKNINFNPPTTKDKAISEKFS